MKKSMILVKYKLPNKMFSVVQWSEVIDGPFDKELISSLIDDPDSDIVWVKQLQDGKVLWQKHRNY